MGPQTWDVPPAAGQDVWEGGERRDEDRSERGGGVPLGLCHSLPQPQARTSRPCAASANASCAENVLLPTPPLPAGECGKGRGLLQQRRIGQREECCAGGRVAGLHRRPAHGSLSPAQASAGEPATSQGITAHRTAPAQCASPAPAARQWQPGRGRAPWVQTRRRPGWGSPRRPPPCPPPRSACPGSLQGREWRMRWGWRGAQDFWPGLLAAGGGGKLAAAAAGWRQAALGRCIDFQPSTCQGAALTLWGVGGAVRAHSVVHDGALSRRRCSDSRLQCSTARRSRSPPPASMLRRAPMCRDALHQQGRERLAIFCTSMRTRESGRSAPTRPPSSRHNPSCTMADPEGQGGSPRAEEEEGQRVRKPMVSGSGGRRPPPPCARPAKRAQLNGPGLATVAVRSSRAVIGAAAGRLQRRRRPHKAARTRLSRRPRRRRRRLASLPRARQPGSCVVQGALPPSRARPHCGSASRLCAAAPRPGDTV